MSTFLFNETIFGPVNSRRLGVSLGINLLSTEAKVCNFDCIYCECGYTSDNAVTTKFAKVSDVIDELSERLRQKLALDAITYAGNGEPTLHPQFLKIAEVVHQIRNQLAPSTRIVLLTNGTTLHKTSVRNALKWMDEIEVKLDAGSTQLINDINQPLSNFSIEQFVKNIQELNRPISIQSLFFVGSKDGHQINNYADNVIKEWLGCLEKIQPEHVILYSIARDTPLKSLRPVSPKILREIAMKVAQVGIKASCI